MALNLDNLVSAMIDAGETMATDIWSQIETLAVPELKKIGVQILAIEQHIGDYTPAGARALMDMQIKAAVGVIVGMTTLTLLAVQRAIDAILSAIKDLVNGALGMVLI